MSVGMRPQDERVFEKAARTFHVWLVVRQTNPASWKYIGLSGCFPKPITCKAKTADTDALSEAGMPRGRYDTAGLVVDPTVHKHIFRGDKAIKARDLWKDFKSEHLAVKGTDHAVDGDPRSPHYGCVKYKGKYLHGDCDLYDIIVVGHERAILAVVGERDGVPDFRPPTYSPSMTSSMAESAPKGCIMAGSSSFRNTPMRQSKSSGQMVNPSSSLQPRGTQSTSHTGELPDLQAASQPGRSSWVLSLLVRRSSPTEVIRPTGEAGRRLELSEAMDHFIRFIYSSQPGHPTLYLCSRCD